MINISAVIITLNEERNIDRCLQSIEKVVDEIIIIDSYSSDKTVEICKKYNARIIQHPFENYSKQKNFGAKQTTFDYILSMDADEALSKELKQSIIAAKHYWEFDAYFFNRYTNFCGKWIRYSGWYPDRQLRLWDKRKGLWDGSPIHEKVKMQKSSEIGFLNGDLLHFSFYTIQEHINQINKFSELKAEELFKQCKKAGILTLILSPFTKFIKHYIVKLGFMDGFYGFVISVNSAHSTFLKYAKLRQKYKSK